MKLQASYTLTPQSHLPTSYLHEPYKHGPYNNDIQIAYSGLKQLQQLQLQPQHKPYRSHFKKRRQGIAEPGRPYDKFQQLKVLNVQASQKQTEKPNKRGTEIAALNLEGKWLEKAEFSIGKRCLVEVYSGMLVITLDEPIKNSDDGS